MRKLVRLEVVFGLGCLALAAAAPGAAQPASLVRDISSEVENPGFGPKAAFYGLQAAGDRLYFGGNGEGSEHEVWVSNGPRTERGSSVTSAPDTAILARISWERSAPSFSGTRTPVRPGTSSGARTGSNREPTRWRTSRPSRT